MNKPARLVGLAAVVGLLIVPSSLAVSAQAASTLPTLTVTVSDSSIAVAGTVQSGAANVVMNAATGSKEPSPALFLLKPGVTVAEVDAYLKTNMAPKDPNTTGKYGSIVFDDEASPGKTTEAQTYLQPGTYVALNGAGNSSAKWPTTSFTVAAAASPVSLPAPAATEQSIDFGFRGPSTLHDGELVRIENAGYVVHMDLAFPVKNEAGAKKVVKALLTGKEKGLEKLVAGAPVNFAGPLSNGAYQQETISAKPGIYVQVCFMQTQDGRSHTRLGMERIIKIVK
ncbi:MAG TPA: hypothetical protein VH081_05335 [Solirubrobacteraceae bacterium]|jgi:hypothetical protein|nr:hypothetical protein [Solirubrobacteraceae bacterium]